MQLFTLSEFKKLPVGEWIECADGLPPVGIEVIVEKSDGRVTALARFLRYEGAPPERGHWDNHYPGHGNFCLMQSIIRWQPMPTPKAK